MSKRRPSNRDRLETLYLATAKERAEMIADYDQRLLQMQQELDGIEAPRLSPGKFEIGDRKDGLDTVRPSLMAEDAIVDDGDEDEGTGITIADFSSEMVDWQSRCTRITRLLVGILRMVTNPEEKQPKLVGHTALLALGSDCESMRTVAGIYALSPERISQRVEDMRTRFNLPKNQHNKSEQAVRSYRATANMTKGAA